MRESRTVGFSLPCKQQVIGSSPIVSSAFLRSSEMHIARELHGQRALERLSEGFASRFLVDDCSRSLRRLGEDSQPKRFGGELRKVPQRHRRGVTK